jgi:hypothetical protein
MCPGSGTNCDDRAPNCDNSSGSHKGSGGGRDEGPDDDDDIINGTGRWEIPIIDFRE